MVDVLTSSPSDVDITSYDIVFVGTNINCSLANGFQHDMKMVYPILQKINMDTQYGDPKKLGEIIETRVGEQLVILGFITRGNFRPDLKSDTLDYSALERCLRLIDIKYKGKSLITSLVGCSKFDGNGDRDKVMELITKSTPNLNVTLLDYTQKSYNEILLGYVKHIMSLKNNDKEAYKNACREYKEFKVKLKKINNLKEYNEKNT